MLFVDLTLTRPAALQLHPGVDGDALSTVLITYNVSYMFVVDLFHSIPTRPAALQFHPGVDEDALSTICTQP